MRTILFILTLLLVLPFFSGCCGCDKEVHRTTEYTHQDPATPVPPTIIETEEYKEES